MAEGPAAQQLPTSQSPNTAAQTLQSLQDGPAEAPPVAEVARPNSKTLVDVEGVTYKRCTHCKELKIRDQNFNKDKSRGDGFACTCKSCANRHTRAWHERHKQQVSLESFPVHKCSIHWNALLFVLFYHLYCCCGMTAPYLC